MYACSKVRRDVYSLYSGLRKFIYEHITNFLTLSERLKSEMTFP